MQHLLYSLSNFIICFKSKLVTFCFLGCHHSHHQMLCEGTGTQLVLSSQVYDFFAFGCLPHHVSAVTLLFSQILRWCLFTLFLAHQLFSSHSKDVVKLCQNVNKTWERFSTVKRCQKLSSHVHNENKHHFHEIKLFGKGGSIN